MAGVYFVIRTNKQYPAPTTAPPLGKLLIDSGNSCASLDSFKDGASFLLQF